MTSPKFHARMSLENAIGAELTQARIRLLEAIDEKGSISQAAKAVPLSYKAAWDALDLINNLSDHPLVTRATGGTGGGGTRLTDYGRRIVAMYRALETEYQTTLDRVAERLEEAEDGDIASFRKLMQRLQWVNSARNQLPGTVSRIVRNEIQCAVHVRLDAENELIAIVTSESAENLGLAEGVEVIALIKASSVMLSTQDTLLISAGNQLQGEVSAVHAGTVNNEVTLQLPSGRSVTAVVTQSSSERLGLQPGCRAWAFFDASSVLLARYA